MSQLFNQEIELPFEDAAYNPLKTTHACICIETCLMQEKLKKLVLTYWGAQDYQSG